MPEVPSFIRRAASALAARTRTRGRSSARHRNVEFTIVGAREIALTGAFFEQVTTPPWRRQLLDRLFAVEAIAGLTLNAGDASVTLHLASRTEGAAAVLKQAAAALRTTAVRHLRLENEDDIWLRLLREPVTLWRHGTRISAWQVQEKRGGTVRFTHPLLADSHAVQVLVRELAAGPGVTRARGTSRRGGWIEIRHAPGRDALEQSLDLLEMTEVRLGQPRPMADAAITLREGIVNVNLAVAIVSGALVPPLRIVNAFLVWLLNAKHGYAAFRAARKGRANLETLYASIGILTIISFEFFGSALMYWFLELWPRRSRHLIDQARAHLHARLHPAPGRVWLQKGGDQLALPAHQLAIGDVIDLGEGDHCPCDGVIEHGEAVVEEAHLTGALRPVSKASGDRILASSRILSGGVGVRVRSHTATHADRLGAIYDQSLSTIREAPDAEEAATSAVLPTLIAGAAAFFRGGLHMTKAVIRPDFLHGPGMTEMLGDVANVVRLAEIGVIVRTPQALRELVRADCIVFDDSVPWGWAGLEPGQLGRRFREAGAREIMFLASGTGPEVEAVAEAIGADTVRANLHPLDRAEFMAQKRHLGSRVVYFGRCVGEGLCAAELAHLAIAVAPPEVEFPEPAQIAVLQPELAACGLLLDLATAGEASLRQTKRLTTVLNVGCMVGAIYLGLPLLGVILVTNGGTWLHYLRARQQLDQALGHERAG